MILGLCNEEICIDQKHDMAVVHRIVNQGLIAANHSQIFLLHQKIPAKDHLIKWPCETVKPFLIIAFFPDPHRYFLLLPAEGIQKCLAHLQLFSQETTAVII